jgi:hypothetical protein
MSRRSCALIVAACLTFALAGCKKQPSTRPLKTSPVTTGAGTIEEARRQLQGRWTLVSLTVTSEDGRQSPVDATGVLNFDGFGNLDIEYRLSEAGQKTLTGLGIKTPGLVLSTSGNVAIDPAQQLIRYSGVDVQKRALEFDPDLAARRANPFTLERMRYYSFAETGELTLTTRYDNGRDAAVAQWKRGA